MLKRDWPRCRLHGESPVGSSENDVLERKNDDCRIRSTRKRVRPADSVRADIITRLCVFPVPPRTCDDICTMTTRTKITHFSTVSRPVEPRYFKNLSYLGSNRKIAVSLPIIRLIVWNIILFISVKKHSKKDKMQRVMKICVLKLQCSVTWH